MSEKINLFELEIDVQALTKQAGEAYQKMNDLRTESSDLKKETKNLKEEIKNYQKQLRDPEVKKSAEKQAELNAKIKDAKQRYDKASIAVAKKETALKNARKEYNLNSKVMDAYNKQGIKELGIINKTDGSINQLKAALDNNRKAYRSLTKEQRENSQQGGKLNELIQKQDAEYKRLQKGIGVTQVEVGNYKEQIKAATSEMGIFSRINGELQGALIPLKTLFTQLKAELYAVATGYKSAAAGTQGYSTAQKAAAIATNLTSNTLKLLKVALISTGIGAFVVALGSLVAYFAKSQEGIDKFNQFLAQVKATLNVVRDRAIKLGGAILDLVTFNWKGFKEKASDAFSGIGDEMSREITLAKELEQKLQDIEKRRVILDIQREASRRTIKELQRVAEDQSKSTEERIQALQRAAKLEEDLTRKELQLGKEKIAQLLGEKEVTKEVEQTIEQFRQGKIRASEAISMLGIDESNLEDLKEFRDVFTEIEAKQRELVEVGLTNQTKLNTIQQQALKAREQQAEKELQKSIEAQKQKMELWEAENQSKARTVQEQLKHSEELHSKEIELLKMRLEAGEINQTEYQTEMLRKTEEYANERSEIVISALEEETDLYIAQNKSRLKEDEKLTARKIEIEKERIFSIYEEEKYLLSKKYGEGLISENEYNLQKLELQREYLNQQKELDQEFDEQQAEKRSIDFENKLELMRLRGASEFELKRQELARQEQAEISTAKRVGASVTAIEKKHSLLRQQINRAENMAKLKGMATVAGAIASITGKETMLSKFASVAQATFNLGVAATKALASAPPPQNFINLAAVLTAGGNLISSIKSATTSKTNQAAGELQNASSIQKAEEGAVFDIGGKRHSSGGTKYYGEDGNVFEAEKDEKMFILNRMASKKLGPTLSRINQESGGRPLWQKASYLAAGGRVQPTQVKADFDGLQIDYDKLAKLIAKRVGVKFDKTMNKLTVVTKVQDIINEVDNYNDVVDGANI